jgi:hypothetical protein
MNTKINIQGSAESFGYIHAFNIIENNQPPNKPTITGPLESKINTEIFYNFTSSDLDNNPVCYFVDWGDNSVTDWTGCDTLESASGEKIWLPHTYSLEGNYTIRAKSRDVLGVESDWSTLEVTMPKPKLMDLLVDWFCVRFPLLFELVNLIK